MVTLFFRPWLRSAESLSAAATGRFTQTSVLLRSRGLPENPSRRCLGCLTRLQLSHRLSENILVPARRYGGVFWRSRPARYESPDSCWVNPNQVSENIRPEMQKRRFRESVFLALRAETLPLRIARVPGRFLFRSACSTDLLCLPDTRPKRRNKCHAGSGSTDVALRPAPRVLRHGYAHQRVRERCC
ncbi:MAG: hypothetical protein JWR21_241 [Herminiimonas sp.]|nr:hypothetical protein [Herminiimonas sp.]